MIYNAFLAVLQWLYNTVAYHDLFFAVILLTLLVRIVLLPFFYKSAKDQLVMKKIAPELERIKQEHKADKERQMREMMAMYKKHKLNPLSGLLVLVVQLPVFFALFKVFRDSALLGKLFHDGSAFLGVDLTMSSIAVSVVAAVLQYVSGNMMIGKAASNDPMQRFNKMMVYMMPVMTLLILTKLPAALGVYWAASTAFSIAQTLVIQRKMAYSDTSKHDDGNKGITDTVGTPPPPHGV